MSGEQVQKTIPEHGFSEYGQIKGTELCFAQKKNSVEKLLSHLCSLKIFIQLKTQGTLF